MIAKTRRSLLLGTLLLCGTAYAQNYAYLDDANERADGPVFSGNYPKIVASETQSDKGSVEAWSKYDVIGAKAGMMYKVVPAQNINPALEYHYSFHPRAYLGYLSSDPCGIAFGMPFNATGPVTAGCSVYAGHWLYKAGTKLAYAINSTTRTLRVANTKNLAVGSYLTIYAAPAGSFRNAEHAKIIAIDKSVNPHRVTLEARGYKSNATPHAANSIVAEHERGSGGSAKNWAYNISINSPRDGNGKRIAEVMADWIPLNMKRNSKGQLQDIKVTGVYFDEDSYVMVNYQADANNDLVIDNGIMPDGRNIWGEGLNEFYRLLRVRLPNKRIVGGWRQTRGFASLNGTQMENWLLAGNDFAVNPDYTGNGGIYSQLHNYMIHLADHQTAEGYSEALSKVPTRLYPGTVKSGPNPPVPANNANFRLGFGAALLGNGHYGRQNSDLHPDPWYDEYAVDVIPDSPSYGDAIASNPNNESKIRRHKGWLGKPLGKRQRIYDSAVFAPEKNLVSNGGFESGLTGWQLKNLSAQIDKSVKKNGAQSLKTTGHISYAKDVGGASLRGPAINLKAGHTYTLVFSAKSSVMRQLYLRLDWSEHQGEYLVPTHWTRFVWTMTAKSSGSFRPIFNLGREDSTVWLDSIYLFEGDPNVFRRDFEHGIVVVNATPKSTTVPLGGNFQRIQGTGQDAINNGAKLSAVTIPPWDAAILVRPDAASIPAPPPPPTNPAPGSGNVTLGGQAWNDSNNDGIRGAGESPFAGLTVRLLNCAEQELARKVTGTDGRYEFAGIAAGNYIVSVILPSGKLFSPAFMGNRGDLDSNISKWPGQTSCMTLVDGNRRLAVDIGLIVNTGGGGTLEKNSTATLGDRVWLDANRNGIQDSSESGVVGAVVTLENCSGDVLQSTTTGIDGHYSFAVSGGSYNLLFSKPASMSFSPALQGSSRAKDSNVNPATGLSGCLIVNDGDDRQWFDVGIMP